MRFKLALLGGQAILPAAGFQPVLALALFACAPPLSAADYSKEALVIQNLGTDVTFAADGTLVWEQNLVVRVQSDAGVRRFGVLTFPYSAANEKIDLVYVRVRKPDGRVVETPESSAQDIPSDVARSAPTYSDLREKQVPVKGLGAGDVLEYRARSTRTRAEVPGHFWFSYDFIKDAIVLEETLRIAVPRDKYVNLKSPLHQPELSEQNGRKIYFWKTAQLEHPQPGDPKKETPATPPQPAVQLTSFKNWEEVGEWYRQLAEPRAAVTDAIRTKAAELTKGLTTNLDKKKAIYNYVSTKFRYIGISFGSGRYQPHSADEVMANQYGDCKDKHTLLAALLKAVGINAWPALIGAGRKLDADLPSPGQFNHLITVLPEDKRFVWLDTTPEVAPYGMLQAVLRDEQALVIPASGTPMLTTTPADLPFPSLERVEAKAALSAEGTLTARMEYTLRGDAELLLRNIFHQTAPAQWQDLVQRFSYGTGFMGTVSNVDVENLENTEAPFQFSYDYLRKEYADWANRRILPPLPPIGLPRDPDADKPAEPFNTGAPGESVYTGTIHLPEGYTIELPEHASSRTEYDEYTAAYAVHDGILSTERRLVVKKSKAPPDAWPDYVKFGKAVVQDEGQFLQLTAGNGTGPAVAVQSNAEAEDLVRQGIMFMQNQALESARNAFAQAERLNPQQRGLWAGYGALFTGQMKLDKAVEAYQREIRNHPENLAIYRLLAMIQRQLKHPDDAIETLRALVKFSPGDLDGALQLSDLLTARKLYIEAADVARKALLATPDNVKLQRVMGEALLRAGHPDEGLPILRKMLEQGGDSEMLNDVAYALADTSADPALARQYAEKAVSMIEAESAKVTLSGLQNENLQRVTLLAAAWDTLGWAYFKLGDLDQAHRYVNAAWTLSEEAACADHLGQIYERQGKTQQAIHSYDLALAANAGLDETRARLKKLGGSVTHFTVPPKDGLHAGPVKLPTPSGADELGKLRTTAIPGLTQMNGSGEFFVLFSARKVEDVQFIDGVESLSKAAGALVKAHYDVPFPDDGPEKIVRRGILSCSTYTTPHCQFVFLLPALTRK
jgi:tetratricopeptide (TPR) repeat protein/transglutaminase-like putative cysteine protease